MSDNVPGRRAQQPPQPPVGAGGPYAGRPGEFSPPRSTRPGGQPPAYPGSAGQRESSAYRGASVQESGAGYDQVQGHEQGRGQGYPPYAGQEQAPQGQGYDGPYTGGPRYDGATVPGYGTEPAYSVDEGAAPIATRRAIVDDDRVDRGRSVATAIVLVLLLGLVGVAAWFAYGALFAGNDDEQQAGSLPATTRQELPGVQQTVIQNQTHTIVVTETYTQTPSPTTTPGPTTSAPTSSAPTSSAPTSSTSTSPTSSGPWYPAGATPCSDFVAGAGTASCEFARNVAEAVRGSGKTGSFTVNAYSPVTGKDYVVSCQGNDVSVCTGGRGAIIYVKRGA